MPQILKGILENVVVEIPQQSGRLQVFGLRIADAGEPETDYRTLEESLAGGDVQMAEVSEGGSVPTLTLVNKGDTPVFLMSGELLVGAKQNRVLNADIFVAAKSELPIPVSCVERGRWSYRSRTFQGSGTSSHSTLRKMMSKKAAESYRTSGRPESDQGEVWHEVTRKLGSMGSKSSSEALSQAYDDNRDRLESILSGLALPSGCRGAAFVFNGRVQGVDLFDKPSTLEKLWPKMVRSYALDALESSADTGSLSCDEVSRWLRSAAEADEQRFKSPGLGDDLRLRTDSLTGAALMIEERPIHLELFPADN